MNPTKTGYLRSGSRRQDDRRKADRRADESMQRLANKVIDGFVKPDADAGQAYLAAQKDPK